jgi:hypothetical protein
MGNNEGDTSQSSKKKDLSKIKSFTCHKNSHYASWCPEKKKRKTKMWTLASIDTQLDEFATKFEKDSSLVSCFSTNTKEVYELYGTYRCQWLGMRSRRIQRKYNI